MACVGAAYVRIGIGNPHAVDALLEAARRTRAAAEADPSNAEAVELAELLADAVAGLEGIDPK